MSPTCCVIKPFFTHLQVSLCYKFQGWILWRYQLVPRSQLLPVGSEQLVCLHSRIFIAENIDNHQLFCVRKQLIIVRYSHGARHTTCVSLRLSHSGHKPWEWGIYDTAVPTVSYWRWYALLSDLLSLQLPTWLLLLLRYLRNMHIIFQKTVVKVVNFLKQKISNNEMYVKINVKWYEKCIYCWCEFRTCKSSLTLDL